MVSIPELCSWADRCYRCCRCYISASATVCYSLPVVFWLSGLKPGLQSSGDRVMRASFIWGLRSFGDFTEQRKMVGHYRRFETTFPSHLQGSYRSHIQGSCLTLVMGWTGCPETSVRIASTEWQPRRQQLSKFTEDWKYQYFSLILSTQCEWSAARLGRFIPGGRATGIHSVWTWLKSTTCQNVL